MVERDAADLGANIFRRRFLYFFEGGSFFGSSFSVFRREQRTEGAYVFPELLASFRETP